MANQAQIREQLRPHGTIAVVCHSCPFFKACGGIQPEQALLSCFDLCRYDCHNCDNVCPRKSDFFERVCEVVGLRWDNSPLITQAELELPLYVPMIHHGFSRLEPLKVNFVALETYQLFRRFKDEYHPIVKSPEELRRRFMLHRATKIILRGTAEDKKLEMYWSYRRRDHAVEKLANLDITLAIGPNFSHFLDVPRTDNLFNRKRQLICLGEFEDAGICPVPHLNVATPGDWQFWKSYLQRNSSVNYVAVEFQTGNRNRKEGRRVIDRLIWLQNEIGRYLHPLIIGGGQFVEYLSTNFTRFTLIDSNPFMHAVKRRAMLLGSGQAHWVPQKTLFPSTIDNLVFDNIQKYSSWIRMRCKTLTRVRA